MVHMETSLREKLENMGEGEGYGFQHMKNLVVRMLKDLFIQLMMRKCNNVNYS